MGGAARVLGKGEWQKKKIAATLHKTLLDFKMYLFCDFGKKPLVLCNTVLYTKVIM